jgi:hypothetical protein
MRLHQNIVIVLLSLSPVAMGADVVVQTDGVTFRGAIVAEDASSVTIQTAADQFIFQRAIPKNRVKNIQRDTSGNALKEVRAEVEAFRVRAANQKPSADPPPAPTPAPAPSSPPAPDAEQIRQTNLATQRIAIESQYNEALRRAQDATNALNNLRCGWDEEQAQVAAEYRAALAESHPNFQDAWATRAREHYEQKTEEIRGRYQPQITQAQLAVDAANRDMAALSDQHMMVVKMQAGR